VVRFVQTKTKKNSKQKTKTNKKKAPCRRAWCSSGTNFDKKIFRAFDKSNGELLWEAFCPSPGNATPATYEVAGRQFVVIAAGGARNPNHLPVAVLRRLCSASGITETQFRPTVEKH